ncbi:hypothetical protein V8F33_007674 [Rhypophila sp. PSN 637]
MGYFHLFACVVWSVCLWWGGITCVYAGTRTRIYLYPAVLVRFWFGGLEDRTVNYRPHLTLAVEVKSEGCARTGGLELWELPWGLRLDGRYMLSCSNSAATAAAAAATYMEGSVAAAAAAGGACCNLFCFVAFALFAPFCSCFVLRALRASRASRAMLRICVLTCYCHVCVAERCARCSGLVRYPGVRCWWDTWTDGWIYELGYDMDI